MLFSSLSFLFVFLPIVLLVNYVLPVKARNYFLLLASLIFYAWGEPKFVIVMIISIVMNYTLAILVDLSDKNKKYLILAIVANLSLLFVFKYLNFAVSNIDNIFNDLLPQTNLPLPIGISFFTFQAMSYVIDVYWKKVKVQKNIFYVGFYISFFPQLIAGPIVRYSDIEERLKNRRTTFDDFSDGVRRFIIGLSKKVIIANNLGIITEAAFSNVADGNLSWAMAWLGGISYTLQIYFDFAGYSDMAIGLGKMFGFKYIENFNYPYVSKSITEFWRRWHISLSFWFKEYLYIPLGGNRVSVRKHILNLLIVWGLTGFWHGANWNFLLWGFYYGILLIFEKYVYGNLLEKCPSILKHVYSMLIVTIGWVIFKDAGTVDTINYLKDMFYINNISAYDNTFIEYISEYWIILLFASFYALAGFKKLKEKLSQNSLLDGILEYGSVLVYLVLFMVSTSYLVLGTYNPFIYFNF